DFDLDSWPHRHRQIPQPHQPLPQLPPALPLSYSAAATAPTPPLPNETQAQIFEPQGEEQPPTSAMALTAPSSRPSTVRDGVKKVKYSMTGVRTRSRCLERLTLNPDSPHEDEPEDSGEHVTAFPMIQVAGPEGTVMVFQPWNERDLKDAMSHLPHPRDSGEKFATDLDMFCQEFSPTMQELKRLLMLKLGATDWHKIRPHFPTSNTRRSKADWNHDDNETYRHAVETLCQQIKNNFPVKVNTTKINYCTQKKDESVDDYYVRLYDTLNRYSEMPEPDDRGDVPQISLMSGLRPEIATIIKQTCIGWEDEKLEKIRQYALHAERLLEEK
ncbi:hypothetical protein M9458_017429, partial [Cirrhinus mrigala]